MVLIIELKFPVLYIIIICIGTAAIRKAQTEKWFIITRKFGRIEGKDVEIGKVSSCWHRHSVVIVIPVGAGCL
jgi:hypothetical protein